MDWWQKIEHHVSHLCIWNGVVDVRAGTLDVPDRGDFHMRGFHGVTPETKSTSHYLTMSTNPKSDPEGGVKAKFIVQTILTFDEDKVVAEAQ